jgi:very-short-patch-repair endonuclease
MDTINNSPPLENFQAPTDLNSPPLERCPKGRVVINNIPLKLNPILDLPYNPILKRRAKELRQAENLSEVLFWMQVTKGRFHKIDFDRQRVIGNYIVDFYVKKLGLVVEIDGSNHIGKEEYDKERSNYLISLGLRVYRIQVVDIMQHLPNVMKALEEYLIAEYGE